MKISRQEKEEQMEFVRNFPDPVCTKLVDLKRGDLFEAMLSYGVDVYIVSEHREKEGTVLVTNLVNGQCEIVNNKTPVIKVTGVLTYRPA